MANDVDSMVEGELVSHCGVELLCVQFLREVVGFLHEHGVAHLNLKPANLLIDGKCAPCCCHESTMLPLKHSRQWKYCHLEEVCT
jgi:serine/threonine protein kinase